MENKVPKNGYNENRNITQQWSLSINSEDVFRKSVNTSKKNGIR